MEHSWSDPNKSGGSRKPKQHHAAIAGSCGESFATRVVTGPKSRSTCVASGNAMTGRSPVPVRRGLTAQVTRYPRLSGRDDEPGLKPLGASESSLARLSRTMDRRGLPGRHSTVTDFARFRG